MINKEKINQELMEKLFKLLKPFPLAAEFILLYRELIHFSDDLIDQPERPTPEQQLEFQELNARVFGHPYYRNNPELEAIEFVINNTYADTVEWEKSDTEWKRRDAQVLRHCGIDMFLYVVAKCCGRKILREISSKFREQCHLMHMNDEFKPI